MKEEWDCLGEVGKAISKRSQRRWSNAARPREPSGRILTQWEVRWSTALPTGHPFKRSGLQFLQGRHTWATQTRWDGSPAPAPPRAQRGRPGDRVIGQLQVICTAVGGEGMFSGPVTARQICDITIMHCHCGLSLKAQRIGFQHSYCGRICFLGMVVVRICCFCCV